MGLRIFSLIRRLKEEYQFYRSGHFGSIWNYIHGFSKATVQNSKITRSNYKEFINDRDYFRGHPYNGVYSSIIDNKLYLPYLFRNYPDYIPTYFFFKDKEGFLPLNKFSDLNPSQRYGIDAFLDLLSVEKKLVLKHCYSSLGAGFLLASFHDNQYELNGKPVSKEILVEKISGLEDYIVTAFVKQHTYSSSICSTSLNTLRLLCVWDATEKTFFVARAFHRFGCNGNVVDNVGSGNGLLVFVDPKTGKFLSSGIMNTKSQGEILVEHIKHPDHQMVLEGIQVPNYTQIVSKVIEICNSMSFLRYVGIDVAITDDGFKIIELNSLPSVEAVQQYEGFLKDSRIRKVLNQ